MTSVMWRLEQLQTRVRIQASQSRFWLRQAGFFWLVCSAAAFSFSVYRHPHAHHIVPWLISAVPFVKTVTWERQPRDGRKLHTYLTATYYHTTPLAWLLWALGCGLLPVSLLGTGGFFYLRKSEPKEKFIRGADLVSQSTLQARLRAQGKPGVTIANVQIPEELHRTHMLVCGATGSGKTVTIRHLLRQIAARGESAVVVDPEGEFVREFYSPERGDYLLNPLDARCPSWNPWSECESVADMEAQAASLFPLTPEMNETATYYHQRARITYRQILEELRGAEPSRIPATVQERLERKEYKDLWPTLTTVQNAVSCFQHLTPAPRSWSAREWTTGCSGWIFLTFRETEKDALLPIISLWLDSLTRRLLASEIAPKRTTWIVIDEPAALRAQLSLPPLFNQGRKRGIAIVIGFQDVLQLHAIYGKELATNMLDQPSTRLLLRTNNAETQRWCSGDIGRREVMRAVESETAGPENIRDGISRSHQQREEPAVMGSEFGGMPNLTGYLKVAHHGTARVTVPYAAMVKRQPAFVGRGEVRESEPERAVSKKRRAV